jgi:NADH-quinone oxidoreductase chain I
LKLEKYGIGIVKGLAVTIKHLFRRPVTLQYPEQKLNTSKRIRGNELIWNSVKCTVCTTCAKTCPQGAIKMVTAVDPANPNKPVMAKIEVDTGYCIMCGLCVESCPYNALFMGYAYERAKYRRQELVQANDQLLASPERRTSAFMHPELEPGLPLQTLLIDKIHEEKIKVKSEKLKDNIDKPSGGETQAASATPAEGAAKSVTNNLSENAPKRAISSPSDSSAKSTPNSASNSAGNNSPNSGSPGPG